MSSLNMPVKVRRVRQQTVTYEKGTLIQFVATNEQRPSGGEDPSMPPNEGTVRAVVLMEDGRFLAIPVMYVKSDV